ncbi:ficolin-2-like [Saccostrea echinata]|uniref:ficolin-2-like n=1 Tax=Saccostrea echinata TaxID=191078 RepID=UPI002A817101|nr:ficolin-2-like [Saccostrea echinata]
MEYGENDQHSTVLPSDCKDILENGHLNSGVYDIFPYGTRIQPVGVYCDMETLNGGWTVIQRRVDGSLSFNRNWAEYKSGFGSPEQNIWLGNDVIHQLTKGKNSFLYVAITLRNGTKLFELYNGFSVSNEAEKYKLFLAGPATGTLGDMMFNPGDPYMSLSGIFFSTPDRDHDRSPRTVGCAEEFMGGWWFYYCHYAYLNGVWSSQSWSRPWYPTFMTGEDVRGTLMLIKRH